MTDTYRRKCQMCRKEFRSKNRYQVICPACKRKSKAERTVTLGEHDETMRRMSDEGVRHQLRHGSPGGTQRAAIEREARRRGITA